ncbi:MAG: LytR/AlgR family response regulator transcription factor [Acidimicrobiia bacterium]
MTIRTLIVDDEPLARQRIRQLAGAESDIAVVGECDSGASALEALARLRPDLMILDIQMPELDGFAVLERADGAHTPLVVFTTAHQQHAIQAFEANALDYLLKPVQPDRFAASIARVRERLTERAAGREGRIAVSTPTRALARLTIKTADRVIVIPTSDVEAFESAGNYVAAHTGEATHILRDSLAALEAQLEPAHFLRVSRSAIINLGRVRELQAMFKGEHVVVLRSGRTLAVTKRLRDVEQALRFGVAAGRR